MGVESDSDSDDDFWGGFNVKPNNETTTTAVGVGVGVGADADASAAVDGNINDIKPLSTTTTTTTTTDTDNSDVTELSKFLPRKSSATPFNRGASVLPVKRFKSRDEIKADEGLWDDDDDDGAGAGDDTLKRVGNNKGKSVGGRKKGSNTTTANTDTNAATNAATHTATHDLTSSHTSQTPRLIPYFPNYIFGTVGPLQPFLLPKTSNVQHSVNGSINRYLKDYQREGIQFCYSRVIEGKGVILGDDMGLGKTIQIIALLCCMFGKEGNGDDGRVLDERDCYYRNAERRRKEEVLEGYVSCVDGGANCGANGGANKASSSSGISNISSIQAMSIHAPVLLIVPASVVDNWLSEFNNWAIFSVYNYRSHPAETLEALELGIAEIVVVPKSLFTRDEHFDLLRAVDWKIVIVDEYHEYKNNRTQCYKNLDAIARSRTARPVIGLTGTPMQNDHSELYWLVDLIECGVYGNKNEFVNDYEIPIKAGRKKDASAKIVARGERKGVELRKILAKFYIARKKVDVLADDLTVKNENVIFVELSQIQKTIYNHILSLPEYVMLSQADEPCDCGLNDGILSKMISIKGKKGRMAFLKNNPFIKKKDCCHKTPIVSGSNANGGGGTLHPDTTMWHKQHPDGNVCKSCCGCMSLSCLGKLYKICSHPVLIMPKMDVEGMREDDANYKQVMYETEFAKKAIPGDVIDEFVGNSGSSGSTDSNGNRYVRSNGMLDNHDHLSGKLKTLSILCKKFKKMKDRVLIFSQSTQTLDIINNWIKTQGYRYLRLDGTTATKGRQKLINEFQGDDSIFCFLISTKAGGMGLNLTAANRVIVYDVNWNPSHDEQAQDRAYRIGQTRDVQVYRLVARGTIEELMYMRQVYKVHLRLQTLNSANGCASGGASGGANGGDSDDKLARLFQGVAKDNNQKGELFGLHNLLKYKDGSFMEEIWAADDSNNKSSSSNNKKSKKDESIGFEVYDENELAKTIANVTEKQIYSGDDTGLVHDDASVSLFDTLGLDTDTLKAVASTREQPSQPSTQGGSSESPRMTMIPMQPQPYIQDFLSQQSSESQRETMQFLKKASGQGSSQLLDSDVTALNHPQTQSLNSIMEDAPPLPAPPPPQSVAAAPAPAPAPAQARVQLFGTVTTEIERGGAASSNIYIPSYGKKKKRRKEA
jgi:SNF2 family DNA or RNA helicase